MTDRFQTLLSNFNLRRYNKGGDGDAEEGAQAEQAALDSAIAEVAAIYLRPTDIEMREELASEWEQGGSTAPMEVILARGRGLHSSTFRLNVSAFCGIGAKFWNC
jgi:hypothetical protein